MCDRKLYLKSYGGPIDPVALLCGFSIPTQREQKIETSEQEPRLACQILQGTYYIPRALLGLYGKGKI